MRALVMALILMMAAPAHADRRKTGKILVGVGLAGLLLVTTAMAAMGSYGNSGDCPKRFTPDPDGGGACHSMMLAGDSIGGIVGPLSAAMIVAGGVVYDRSSGSDSAATLRIRF
jgi:hypothetical protein